MDLSYFDELIKEADVFMASLAPGGDSGIFHNLLVNYKGFTSRIKKLKKRSFSDYQTSLKHFDILAKKSKDELKKTFIPIVNQARNQLNNIRFNYWHQSARSSGLRNKVTEALDFLDNFYEQFSDGLQSFEGQLYENNKIDMYTNIFEKFCEAVNNIVSSEYATDLQYRGPKSATIVIRNESSSDRFTNFLLEEANGEVIVSTLGTRARGFKVPQLAAKFIMMELEYDSTEYPNNFRYTKKINSPLQEMKIVKTISAKQLKKQLKESRDSFALGQGFGNKPAYESNVDNELDKFKRKFNSKGGFGYGDGFKQMDEAQLVKFIENIVESLRGKTEYHNLKFVDRIGGQYKLAEGQIKTIKKILKSDQSPKAAKRLKKYINENVAPEMHDIYEGYYGLTNEAEAMIPEIKKCFNENKKATGTVQEAVSMTAEQLDIPMEMVQEMYNKLKEAYETQMESGAIDNMNESLSEIFNRYRGMSEGSMDGLTDEISEMMGYEDDMPEPREPRFDRKSMYDDEEEEWGPSYEDQKSASVNFSSDKFVDNGHNFGDESYADQSYMDDQAYYLDEEICLDCEEEFDFEDKDEFEGGDYKYNPELSRRGNENSFERPMYMNESALSQSKKKIYKYDTGLNISANEALIGSKDMLREFNEALKNISKVIPIKVSSCGKYLKVENKVYYTHNGDLVSNVLSERLLAEERGWAGYILDWGQTIASVASAFIPGSGILVESVNSLIYFIRGLSTSDEERRDILFLNGCISAAFAVAGPIVQAFGAPLKLALTNIKAVPKAILTKALLLFKGVLSKVSGRILAAVGKLKNSAFAVRILGKKGLANIEANMVNIKNGADRAILNITKGQGFKASKGVISGAARELNPIDIKLMGGMYSAINAGNSTARIGRAAVLTPSVPLTTTFKVIKSNAAKNAIVFTEAQALQFIKKSGITVGKTYPISTAGFTGAAKLESLVGGKAVFTVATKSGGKETINIALTALPNSMIKTFKSTRAAKGKLAILIFNMFGGSLINFKTPDESQVTADLKNINDEIPSDESSREWLEAAGMSVEDVGVADYEGDSQNYTVKNEVSAVQTALQDVLGISVGSTGIDGKYGPATKEAIQQALDISGFPMETKMTAKSIIGIGVAILRKKGIGGKTAVSELFNKAITDSEVLNAANQIINNSKSTADFMAQKLMSLAGVTQKTFDTPMTEGTFHENYKRIFG